jgi:hypothetical protein
MRFWIEVHEIFFWHIWFWAAKTVQIRSLRSMLSISPCSFPNMSTDIHGASLLLQRVTCFDTATQLLIAISMTAQRICFLALLIYYMWFYIFSLSIFCSCAATQDTCLPRRS